MKNLRIISLIILIIAVFVSLDLGFNYLQAITTQISSTGDGITIYGIFARIFLGDRGGSYQAYLNIFKTSAWISFAVAIENALLEIFDMKKGR